MHLQIGHVSFGRSDPRSFSSMNASLKERDVICQLPPYSFRFPQEQYIIGSNTSVHLKIDGRRGHNKKDFNQRTGCPGLQLYLFW